MKKIGHFSILLVFLILVLLVLNRFSSPFKQIDSFTSIQGQIILAAGDIGECTSKAADALGTAKLLEKFPGIPILALGDIVYPYGEEKDYKTCFDPTWGRVKDRIYPSLGNHDYKGTYAKPYFDYFGEKAGDFPGGYYSFNLGNWHLVSVNTIIMGRESLCSPQRPDMCEGVKEQWEWLRKDLQQNKTNCTLVFGHYPLFSSQKTADTIQMKPLWELLYRENVDVMLNGHAHVYERFAPQTPEGKADVKRGIREFVVGTGGADLSGVSFPLVNNSEVANDDKHGVLKLVLGKGEYEWEFLSTDGSFVDKGRDVCQ